MMEIAIRNEWAYDSKNKYRMRNMIFFTEAVERYLSNKIMPRNEVYKNVQRLFADETETSWKELGEYARRIADEPGGWGKCQS